MRKAQLSGATTTVWSNGFSLLLCQDPSEWSLDKIRKPFSSKSNSSVCNGSSIVAIVLSQENSQG